MTIVILAVLAPFLMIIFLTRVTFNHYISTLLTIGIVFAIFKGYGEPLPVTVTWVFSIIVGFLVASKMMKKLKNVNKKKYDK